MTTLEEIAEKESCPCPSCSSQDQLKPQNIDDSNKNPASSKEAGDVESGGD